MKNNIEHINKISRLNDVPVGSAAPESIINDVMNSMEQGVIVWDSNGVCEIHNARVFEVLELKTNELYAGLSRIDFLQMAVHRGEFDQSVADQATKKFELCEPFSFSRTMPSGREIITTARPRSSGGFVVTFSDITLMKEKETELNESKQRAEIAEAELSVQLKNLTLEKAALEKQQTLLSRLSMVATHAKDMVAITKACGEIEWVNNAFIRALGYRVEDIVGQTINSVICGKETCVMNAREISDCIENRNIVRTELMCCGDAGRTFWMELEVTPVFSEEGEHTHFIAVGRDTTTRKTAELNADEAREYELRKRNEAALLAEFNGWLQSTGSLDELFQVVSAFLKQILPMSSGAVYVYANSRDVLEGVCHWNDGKMLKNFEPPDCWALRRGRSYYYGENAVDFPCHHVQESHGEATPERHYCLPIIAHGDTVGLLCVELNNNHNDNMAEETQKLSYFCAEQISLAIANVQMREQLMDQSTKDALTSLYNRRYFIEQVRRDLSRSQENKTASVISLDVDHFKKFNDTYGHDAGDTVLRAMSQVLLNSFRGSDTPCRYGGEEFAVYMPGASATIAMQRAQELRMAVEAEVVRYSGEELKITISSGIATYPDNGTSVQSLIKSADKALYAAKDSGRNAVKHFNELKNAGEAD